MPRNKRYFASIDLETTGLDVTRHEPIEIACQIYDPRTLEAIPAQQGGLFHSHLAPTNWDIIQDQALAVNRLTRDELRNFPAPGPVWRRFVDWLRDFNPSRNLFTAPIAVGKNLRQFDLPLLAATNQRHGGPRKKNLLFHPRTIIDLEDIVFWWFEDDDSLPSYKMDDLRPYFGFSSEGAHTALVDCQQTGSLVMAFLKMHRRLRQKTRADGSPLLDFRGAFAGNRQ